MSLYSHAGVSKQNGEFKVRFANDALRVKVLAKNGHKDIDIVELKKPMTKEAAVAYLLSIDFANGNKAVQSALEAAADKRGVTVAPAPVKAPAKPKAKKAKELTDAEVEAIVSKAESEEPRMTVKEANARILAQLAAQEAAPF
jgi:hypothetical protein